MRTFILLLFVSYLFIGCSSTVATPNVSSISSQEHTIFKAKKYDKKIKYQNLNDTIIQMPDIGEKNAYGITITPELKIAYETYLSGDGQIALDALEKAQNQTSDDLTLWQISFLKVKAYMVLGRDADAFAEVKNTMNYEIKFSKSNLNSIALRGQIYLMEGNLKKAREDFHNVLSKIGDWELPTSYGLPPSNVDELVALTTAKLRSYTGLAASYVMEFDYSQALFWATEAEKRFNAVHYVSNHGLYGMFISSHLDSYYGRAMNMVMLASATLGTTKSLEKANKYYDEALTFFNNIGFQKGQIILLALKAQTLSSIGKTDAADDIALKTIAIASKKRMYDFIWRIEIIRGVNFLKEDKLEEAEKSFRKAANVVDLVSGDLQTDSAKQRFGIGKSELVYHLMNLHIKSSNFKQLFKDLEQGRARSFVDIMRNRTISQDKNNIQLQKIRKLDKQIKKLAIENSSINILATEPNIQPKVKEVIKVKKQPEVIDSYDNTLKELEARLIPDAQSVRDRMNNDVVNRMIEKLKMTSKQVKKPKIIKKEKEKVVITPSVVPLNTEEKLRSKRKLLVANLIQNNPNSASTVSIFSNSLTDIQKALTKNETILYFLPVKKDEKVKALLIENKNVVLKTYNITPTKLSSIMKDFLISIEASSNSISQELRSFKKNKKTSNKSSPIEVNSSLSDIHKYISLSNIKTKKLFVVGSGATTYIPWGTYSDKLEISILPNASWLLNKNKPQTNKNIVIVGNPNYGGELSQLDGTTKEAQALAKIYNTEPLLFKNATLENIYKKVGKGAKVLHLATHGVFYNDKPLESAIFLSKDSKLFTLTAKDIFESPIKADLVVLSACETGMGKNVAGDDLIGLPRSFFLGGSRAILSSLWPIDDAGTKEFMLIFHKYAKNNEYSKGLLEAKEALKDKGYPASVYGAFVLYGTGI